MRKMGRREVREGKRKRKREERKERVETDEQKCWQCCVLCDAHRSEDQLLPRVKYLSQQ